MFPLAHIGFAIGIHEVIGRYLGIFSGLDIRFLVLGALLPDLVDKPVGYLFPIGGRALMHSIVIVFALFLVMRKFWIRSGVVNALFLGSVIHLLLDKMFLYPRILFWPLLGFEFPIGTMSITGYLDVLLRVTWVQVSELVGLLVIVGFVGRYGLWRGRRLWDFVVGGELEVG